MTDTIDTPETTPRRNRKLGLILAAAALIGVGGAGGAYAVAHSRPSVTMAPANPVAIASLADDSLVTVRGKVAEEFGNRFILADGSGRALVDAGREGEVAALVAPGETVTVQGRFDRGSIHAAFLVKADGKVTALGPMRGPHDRRGGPDGPRHGREHQRSGPPMPSEGAPAPAAPEPVANAM